ncbi:checkpoint clamp complex protein Rad1 [Sorochytrium milnesiophthora]
MTQSHSSANSSDAALPLATESRARRHDRDACALPGAFVAYFDNVAFLASLLRCIHITPGSPLAKSATQVSVTCTASRQGFRFVVRDATVQAAMYAQRSLCRTYQRYADVDAAAAAAAAAPSENQQDDDVPVTVNMATLLDCLNLYNTALVTPQPDHNLTIEQLCAGFSPAANHGGGQDGNADGGYAGREPATAVSPHNSTMLKFSCCGQGHPLELLLDQHQSTSGFANVTTHCKLSAIDTDVDRRAPGATLTAQDADYFEYAWNAFPEINKVIMKSSWLRDALSQFDQTCERVSLLVSPHAPNLRVAAQGITGITEVECSRSSDVIESFAVTEEQTFSYPYATLVQCMRALALSSRISLRINGQGILNLQVMINVTKTETAFVEFVMMPLDKDLDGL